MTMYKNVYYILIVMITLFSCSKNIDLVNVSTSSDQIKADALSARIGGGIFGRPRTTEFGVLPANREISDRLTAAQNLSVDHVREAVMLSDWKGHDGYVDKWLDNGYKIIMNINNDYVPSPFPTDLVTYESNLRSVLDVYQPEVVVIENEELNAYDPSSSGNIYHTGSLENYIRELAVAVNVCNQNNLQVTNGGLTNPVISSLWNYYIVNNKPDSARWLSEQMSGVSQDPVKIARADTLLQAYKELNLSFVNLHWYEPMKDMNRMTGVLQVVIDYITQQTGKDVITNETGVKTDDPVFVANLMQQWDDSNAKYVIFYDSNGVGVGGAYPLTTPLGILLPNGFAFKAYNLTH